MTTVAIGLGSNIQSRANLIAAADLIRNEWSDVRFSSVYQSKAAEVTDQDDFLNAVAVIETTDDPVTIRGKLTRIEEELGKAPPFRFGPRTIDLDILLFGDEIIETPELCIPHPRMHQRRFVLEPLVELIEGREKHPALGGTWNELLQVIQNQDCTKIGIVL